MGLPLTSKIEGAPFEFRGTVFLLADLFAVLQNKVFVQTIEWGFASLIMIASFFERSKFLRS